MLLIFYIFVSFGTLNDGRNLKMKIVICCVLVIHSEFINLCMLHEVIFQVVVICCWFNSYYHNQPTNWTTDWPSPPWL